MIATLGDLVDDVVVHPRGPLRPSTDTPARIERRRGGSAANVASMVARLGGAARFIGSVGADRAGDQLVSELVGDGVDVWVRRHPTASTGTIVVVVDEDGERSFLTDRGASVELDDADSSCLAGVTALHIPAYSFAAPPLSTTAIELAVVATDSGIPVSVDASSTGALTDLGVERFLEVLGTISPDSVLANADEAELLSLGEGRPAPGTSTTIVRHGAAPTLVVDSDGTTVSVPVPPVDDVLDTTGAGDGFAAGWLMSRGLGHAVLDAVAEGHAVAARVLRSIGATLEPSSIPSSTSGGGAR